MADACGGAFRGTPGILQNAVWTVADPPSNATGYPQAAALQGCRRPAAGNFRNFLSPKRGTPMGSAGPVDFVTYHPPGGRGDNIDINSGKTPTLTQAGKDSRAGPCKGTNIFCVALGGCSGCRRPSESFPGIPTMLHNATRTPAYPSGGAIGRAQAPVPHTAAGNCINFVSAKKGCPIGWAWQGDFVPPTPPEGRADTIEGLPLLPTGNYTP